MKVNGALAALCCLCLLALSAADESKAVAVTADAAAGEDGINTYYRPQAELTTSDPSTEEKIPGLEPTNVPGVKRAIPNLEQLAPLLTLLAPFLPSFYRIFNALGIYLPNSWPLAETGPTGDWMQMVVAGSVSGLLGTGPRPPLAPVTLVAAPEAYAKLPVEFVKNSGLPPLPSINPVKRTVVGHAVFSQISRNMMLPESPELGKADNGTIVKTLHGEELILVVRDDGRYLVSNTTQAKLLHTDIRIGSSFFTVVDNFFVPKIDLIPRKPQLFTQEELDRLPQELQMIQDSFREMPKAFRQMPGAIMRMVREQLPPEHQQLLDRLSAPVLANITIGRRH